MPIDADAIEAWLPGWLPEQRWFGDKSRPISDTRLLFFRRVDDNIAVCVVRITFVDGHAADYVVPTKLRPLSDASGQPQFLAWLASLTSGETAWPGVITRHALSSMPVALGDLPATPLGVEQSNTTIRYGAEWAVKLIRRLSYGPSPEVELAPLLNRWSGQRCAPRAIVALDIQTDTGVATFALQAEFVENQGDGWSIMLDALRDEHAAGATADQREISIREVGAIAELTADLHSALSLDPWTTDLAPERIDRETTLAWQHAIPRALEDALTLLDASRPALSGRSRLLADLVSTNTPTIREHVKGFQALVGSQRMRVHGDYHLGQTLRTAEGRYVAIDFDGEPQRSLAERRAKYSPLRDVAGMLGSLAYAAGSIREELEDRADDAAFAAWLSRARAVFVDRYRQRLADNGTSLLPREPEAIRQALAALELEKAIYEVVYELNNRPGWVWIPLSQLVRMA